MKFETLLLVDTQGPKDDVLAPLAKEHGLEIARVDHDQATHAARAKGAWYWPEAASSLERVSTAVGLSLTSHVEGQAGTDPRFLALEITKRTARLLRSLDEAKLGSSVVGVEFEPTHLLHSKEAFLDQCDDAAIDDPPVYLWVRFVGVEDSSGRGMRTEGLAHFGLLEVEVSESSRDGEFILENVADMVALTLIEASAIDDGEQVELTHGKVRVRITPSMKNDGSRVQRLRLS